MAETRDTAPGRGRMTNRQVRALVYGTMFVVVAVDRTFVGAALFLALMDFVEGAAIRALPQEPQP